jgi:hypothetical protein
MVGWFIMVVAERTQAIFLQAMAVQSLRGQASSKDCHPQKEDALSGHSHLPQFFRP